MSVAHNPVDAINPEKQIDICTTFHGKSYDTAHSKLLTSICSWRLRKLNKGITKVIGLHPLETMNVWAKFHGNSSNNCFILDQKKKKKEVAIRRPPLLACLTSYIWVSPACQMCHCFTLSLMLWLRLKRCKVLSSHACHYYRAAVLI